MRVVIGHPRICFGGSEATLMWLVEALKHEYEVTVMTTDGWDLAALNTFYGTQIRKREVRVRIARVPTPFRGLSVAALRGACYQRFASQIAAEYDIRISAYNMTDWGLPAIHFLADFSWHRGIRGEFDPPSPGLIHQDSLVRRIYLRVAAAHENPSGRNVLLDDVVIANSRWSAAILKQYCGISCMPVVYPPVSMGLPQAPWEKKEQAFVMIGRIAPEKRIERAFEILNAVRQRGHAVRLHLCGQIEGDRYGQEISRLCRENAEWVIPEGRVSGEEKARILTQCRFGIQTREAEPFGISVAEMIKAGAIVFAPSKGGQAEILDSPDLLFTDADEAVKKIATVLESSALQSSLRIHLAAQGRRFSTSRFVNEVQALVAHHGSSNKHAAVVS